MEITIKANGKYKEVHVSVDSVSFETGLLDEKEAKKMAEAFIHAAAELLQD